MGHILQDFDDRLVGREGECVANQERVGGVDKSPFTAYEAAQPDIEAGSHQDVGRHGVAVEAGERRAPEQQFVAADTLLQIRLAAWSAPENATATSGPCAVGRVLLAVAILSIPGR